MTYERAAFSNRCLFARLGSYMAGAATSTTIATIENPSETGWFRDDARAQPHDLRLEMAIRQACGEAGHALRTLLTMPGFGRFEIAVDHRSSPIVVQIHCDTRPGYVWLSAKRLLLEHRLSHALGRRASVAVSAGTS